MIKDAIEAARHRFKSILNFCKQRLFTLHMKIASIFLCLNNLLRMDGSTMLFDFSITTTTSSSQDFDYLDNLSNSLLERLFRIQATF